MNEFNLNIIQQEHKVNVTGAEIHLNYTKNPYTHSQDLASTEWTVNHNLGYYPSVVVIDSAGTVIVGDVEYLGTSQLKIYFSAPFSGKAYLV